jgi:hypothetical protein
VRGFLVTVFEFRPHPDGWQCLEAPGVAPYFTRNAREASAISYAKGRTAHRFGKIRLFNAAGELEQANPLDE